jgi:hypothetical protein
LACWRSFPSGARHGATKCDTARHIATLGVSWQNKPNASCNVLPGKGLNQYEKRSDVDRTRPACKPVLQMLGPAAWVSDNWPGSHKTLSPCVDNPNKTRQKCWMPRGFGVGQTSRFAYNPPARQWAFSVVQNGCPSTCFLRLSFWSSTKDFLWT